MDLSITTDFISYTGDPVPALSAIAGAGFSHVHWCHEWNTRHVYSPDEIDSIGRALSGLGLRMLDLHAPHGSGTGWGSTDDAERRSSISLIMNRIEMTGALGGAAVVLHLPARPDDQLVHAEWRSNLDRSLDLLMEVASGEGIGIALENMPDDDFDLLSELFVRFPKDSLGLCYDSGHGNIGRDGLDELERWRHRLISVHIHDNDGIRDRHSLPFDGTVDWERLARLIGGSRYRGCVSLESNMRMLDIDGSSFLAGAFRAASRLAGMIEASKGDVCGRSGDITHGTPGLADQ